MDARVEIPNPLWMLEISYSMQLAPNLYKILNTHFHGGDTGSTPVRDATFFSNTDRDCSKQGFRRGDAVATEVAKNFVKPVHRDS